MTPLAPDPADAAAFVDTFNTPANKPRRDGNIKTDELLAFVRRRGGACLNYYQSQLILKHIDALEARVAELEHHAVASHEVPEGQ